MMELQKLLKQLYASFVYIRLCYLTLFILSQYNATKYPPYTHTFFYLNSMSVVGYLNYAYRR